MRRVTVILGLWLVLIVGAAVAGYRYESGRAASRGWTLYGYREILRKQLRETSRSRPGVVWLGDSTMLGLKRPSYPQLLQGVEPDVSASVLGFIGSDFFTYYSLVGELLATHRPAVLVTVAHLRLFRQPSQDPTGMSETRNDLFSMIPTAELPRALRLPFSARGVSMPRLLLIRLLRYQTIERFFYFLEGAHKLVAEAEVPWLGPNDIDRPGGGFRAIGIALKASDISVSPDHPTVRLMAATVRMAREAGVRVVVVGTPLPFEGMGDAVGYDPALYAARFAVLREAVEGAGGVFVDLHEALPRDGFVDPVGHFTVAGAGKLAERIRPVVADELRRYRWDTFVANHPKTTPAADAPAAAPPAGG
jgi:hypothetical protein